MLAALAGVLFTTLPAADQVQRITRIARIGYLGVDGCNLPVMASAPKQVGWIEGTSTRYEK